MGQSARASFADDGARFLDRTVCLAGDRANGSPVRFETARSGGARHDGTLHDRDVEIPVVVLQFHVHGTFGRLAPEAIVHPAVIAGVLAHGPVVDLSLEL